MNYKKKHKNNKSSINYPNIINTQYIKNLENIYQDSLEANNSLNSKTNILIPDSLNQTQKSNMIDINTPTKIDNNLFISKSKNNNKYEFNEEETKKIDYRYYTNYPIKIINNNSKNNKLKKFHWLAVYDKLMKKKKIMNILNYYEKKYEESDIKEKVILIKDFDIYFVPCTNKLYIKYLKNGFIFVKLYLLSIQQINVIISYLNRINYNFNENIFNSLHKKGSFQVIDNKKSNLKYNILYCLGIYMNAYIYSFSYLSNINDNIDNQNKNRTNNSNSNFNTDLYINEINQKYPDSKKVAKLIKLLIVNFPQYSIDFFICYLLSKIKFKNFNEKSKEIKNYIYIKKIPTFNLLKKNNDNRISKTNNNVSLKTSSLSNYNSLNNSRINNSNNLHNLNIDLNTYKSNNNSFFFNNKSFQNRLNKNKNDFLRVVENYTNLKDIKQKDINNNNNKDEIKKIKNNIILFSNIINKKLNVSLISKDKNKNKNNNIILNKNKHKNLSNKNINKNNISNPKIDYKKIIKNISQNKSNNNISNRNSKEKYYKKINKIYKDYKKGKKKLLKKSKNNNIENKGIFVVKRMMTNFQNFEDDSLLDNNNNNVEKNKSVINNNKIQKELYFTPPKTKKNKLIYD